MTKISVVIPLYNEELILNELLSRVCNSVARISEDYEVVCVDDGSTDRTLKSLIDFKKNNNRIKIIGLSRNFGHQAAYSAGLAYSQAEYVCTMDGDLQDPPEIIPDMLHKAVSENLDIVYGKRKSRGEGLAKKISIMSFHYIFNKLSRQDVPTNVGNFALMNRKSVDAFLMLQEKNRYLPGLRFYIGFKQGYVEYDRLDRATGKSKMGFVKLTSLALDAIFSFSKLPIRIALFLGILGVVLSFSGAAIVVIKKLTGDAISGWTSTMLGIYFLGSIQLFFLGVFGEYLYRIFVEAKQRPLYIVKEVYD